MVSENTTVTKCPACGKVTVGMPESCPSCHHVFALPDANLPVMREQTTEFQTQSLTERTREQASRTLPRHVVVPVIAGLLVAVVVVVVVRLNAPTSLPGDVLADHHRQAMQQPAGAPLPASDDDPLQDSGRSGGVPSLGPGARRIIPVSIIPEDAESDDQQPREAVLFDGSPATCYFTRDGQDRARLVVRFEKTRRFSHVLFHVSCLRTTDRSLRGEVTLITDDGAVRTLHIPGVAGPTWVDLAGAWTRRIEVDLGTSTFNEIGLGELEFFAFDE